MEKSRLALLMRKTIEERLKEPRSLREYVMFKVVLESRRVLDKNGVCGPLRVTYLNFTKKILRQFWDDVAPVMGKLTDEEFKDMLGEIIDWYEKTETLRYGLNRQILMELERVVVDTLSNLDRLAEGFDELKA